MNEDDLWDMSDEELEAAFKEAKAEQNSPDLELEEMPETSEQEDFDESASDEDAEEDGPEQPEDSLEDSDHDASLDSDDEESDDEDSEETEEDDLDEDSEDEEDTSSDDDAEEDEDEQPVQNYKFKANGKDYEFTSEEIVDQFPKIFGQAMDYTKKMQAIKPWRKTIDAIENAKLGHNDINLMIDVLKGDKGAISEVLKRTGVDTLDLDSDEAEPYVAKDYGRDDNALAIKDVVDVISQDAEYTVTHNILSKEWDDRSWSVMSENPEMIKLLHTDVKSGMYDTLLPIAEKLKVFDGGKQSDLDYYKAAAQQHFTQIADQEAYEQRQADLEAEQERLANVKAKSRQRTATKQASAKRKAAAPTKNAVPSRDVIDYLDASDDDFDEWYKKLQDDM